MDRSFLSRVARFLPAAIAVTLLADLALLPAHPAPPAPNLIVISIDSLRADHMSLYGYGRNTTPNIDAWAKGGFVFDNYFSTSYLTPTSEASVQTGQYPFDNGIISFSAQARGTTQFLAEILKQHGYRTAAFGSSPEYGAGSPLATSFSRGFDVYEPFDLHAGSQPVIDMRTSPVSIREAISWLEAERATGQPFYLWVPLGGVHQPFNDGSPMVFTDPSYHGFLSTIQNDEFENVYGFILDGTRYAPGTAATLPARPVGALTTADTQYLVGRYDDGIHATDALLGQLFAYVRQTGLDKNTIVIVESEHGEFLGERGYFWHYDIYDEALHTPLIITVPGVGGRKVNALASGVDVLPTVLSFLHLSAPAVDGIDYRAYLSGLSASVPRSDVFVTRTPLWEGTGGIVPAFEKKDATAHYYDTAIRSTRWKLIHRVSRAVQETYGWWGLLTGHPTVLPEYQLYDLANDPGETADVYAAHQDDPDVAALRLKLDAFDASIVEKIPGPDTAKPQPYF